VESSEIDLSEIQEANHDDGDGGNDALVMVFGSVVVVAFQIAFRAEIHANDVFLFFKNYF
jgi:hypothetical protein